MRVGPVARPGPPRAAPVGADGSGSTCACAFLFRASKNGDPMHQAISVVALFVVAFLLNAPFAAMVAADGNWGEAVGSLLIGPVVFYYAVHSLVYFTARFLRGRSAVATYTASRLNYVALAISVLGVLGAAAQRAIPPV